MTKKILYPLIAFVVIISITSFIIYTKIYGIVTVNEGYVYIPTNASVSEALDSVSHYTNNSKNLSFVAKLKKFNTSKPGKYFIEKGMSNNDIINLLRSGKQTPINVSFNNQDTFENLAGRIALQIEADSISLLKAFTDENFISKNNFTSEKALVMYIPNTYQFYWNTNAIQFRDRMLTEYTTFWNNDRKEKAKKLQLSPEEVIILASIVQKETSLLKERPIVAKLYLNRLQEKWPLQADPTIIYALKKLNGFDKTYKRVLSKDLKINSPYNTYIFTGLPPGPIGMPDISSIDAVLNPTEHNFYYMCASTTEFGAHEFAKTLREHNKNALRYQKWLNNQKVFR